MQFNKDFFKLAVPQVEFLGQDMPENFSISIDSLSTKSGDIFIILDKDNKDEHELISEVINKNISGIIINQNTKDLLNKIDSKKLSNLFIALVPDTKQAIISLAKKWRELFKGQVIGITGSVGKTSTKQILSNILELAKIPFIASETFQSFSNQNPEIIASFNILKIKPHHQVALIEMGITKRGQMGLMADIVMPTSACITSIGHSHMDTLGSILDIANEKKDIFKNFKESNIGIINGDQPILANISYKHLIIKFGTKTTNQIQARKIQINNLNTSFIIKIYKDRYNINLDTNHPGRITNVLAATSIAQVLEVPSAIIAKAIQMPIKINSIFEQTKIKSQKGILIDDCHNASPESMKAALLAFEKFESKGQKIAILGDMTELGVNSSFWHRQLGRFLRKTPSLNHVILVGDLVESTKNTVPLGLSFEYVKNWKEAVNQIKKRLDKEAVILVKGSKSVGLNNLVQELKE